MTAKDFIATIPERAKHKDLSGLETVLHFKISGEKGGDFTIEVKDEKIITHEGLTGIPKCTIQGKDTHFENILKGNLNPMMAVLTGKIKVDNKGELLKYANLIGLM